jgi:serine/threonine protein kinase
LLRLGNAEPKTAKNELRSIKRLCNGEHPHIIQVFGFGDLPDGSHIFIDMELCSVNLDQYNKGIRTAVLVHDFMSTHKVQEIWIIFTQIVSALAFIHSHHEIHRDLKPQNSTLLIWFG